MNRVNNFRKKCQEAKTPWKRTGVVYSFIREDLSDDLSLDVPENIKKRSIFHSVLGKKKTNTQIVLEELHRFMRKYGEFHIFATLAESPTIATDEDLQMLYNIFIKEIKSTNKGQIDRVVLKVAKRFSKIMDENNFLEIYPMFRKSAIQSIEKINTLVQELSDIKHRERKKNIQEVNLPNPEEDSIRGKIIQERKKFGDDLLDPFFELLGETFKYIKDQREDKTRSDITESNNESADAMIQKLFDHMYEDLSRFYGYIHSFEEPIRLYYDNPSNSGEPNEFVDLYEYLMKFNIFPFQNIGKCDMDDFQNMVTGIKNSFIPNISWSNDRYKTFLDLCLRADIDIPLAFLIIDAKKGSNPELDDIFNNFLVNHKDEYMEWCIYGDKGYYDYKFQNKKIYTDNDVKVYSIIVDELIKRQSDKNVRYIDIRNSGNGSTSSAVMVGDYIVKSGLGRYENDIPNHRRILQPIIRGYNENAFFEVADVVDMDVTPEELNQVYYELLSDGIAWTDPGMGNIGRLKRKNIPRHNVQKVVKSYEGESIFDDLSSSDENATNMTGSIQGDDLDKGECVIIDTDLIYDLRKIDRAKLDSIQFPPYMTPEMIEDLRRRFEELHVGSGGTEINYYNIGTDEGPEGR